MNSTEYEKNVAAMKEILKKLGWEGSTGPPIIIGGDGVPYKYDGQTVAYVATKLLTNQLLVVEK